MSKPISRNLVVQSAAPVSGSAIAVADRGLRQVVLAGWLRQCRVRGGLGVAAAGRFGGAASLGGRERPHAQRSIGYSSARRIGTKRVRDCLLILTSVAAGHDYFPARKAYEARKACAADRLRQRGGGRAQYSSA